MLLKLILIAFVLCLVTFDRLKAEDLKDGSASGPDEIDLDDPEEEEEDDMASGDKSTSRIAPVLRQPPSVDDVKFGDDDEELEKEEKIDIDEEEGNQDSEEIDHMKKEQVAVKENSLITHPGILTAIIVGGVLVLFCLILFFILIVCCVKKKDEGTYDLDEATKAKLKYVTYTKAETSEKEFFA